MQIAVVLCPTVYKILSFFMLMFHFWNAYENVHGFVIATAAGTSQMQYWTSNNFAKICYACAMLQWKAFEKFTEMSHWWRTEWRRNKHSSVLRVSSSVFASVCVSLLHHKKNCNESKPSPLSNYLTDFTDAIGVEAQNFIPLKREKKYLNYRDYFTFKMFCVRLKRRRTKIAAHSH